MFSKEFWLKSSKNSILKYTTGKHRHLFHQIQSRTSVQATYISGEFGEEAQILKNTRLILEGLILNTESSRCPKYHQLNNLLLLKTGTSIVWSLGCTKDIFLEINICLNTPIAMQETLQIWLDTHTTLRSCSRMLFKWQ